MTEVLGELMKLGGVTAAVIILTGMWSKWGSEGRKTQGEREQYVRRQECRELCEKHHECLERLTATQTTQTEILRNLTAIMSAVQVEVAKVSGAVRRNAG